MPQLQSSNNDPYRALALKQSLCLKSSNLALAALYLRKHLIDFNMSVNSAKMLVWPMPQGSEFVRPLRDAVTRIEHMRLPGTGFDVRSASSRAGVTTMEDSVCGVTWRR